MSFYQEDGLPGTFVIDLEADLDNMTSAVSDEITNEEDLEFLSKMNTEDGVEEYMDDQDMSEDEEEAQDDLPEYAPNDPNDFLAFCF